ncbi:MAG: hypothetical protein KF689_06345 [Gemmatimonadaceae bacterium]|nr:hypothetical protein [Gemmatimonadaceae bacterium]
MTADSLPAAVRDTVDTLAKPPRDTIKTPFAVSERPATPELRGRQWVWDRERIYLTGAHNLAELVAEVPGASLVRSSYLMAPTSVSWFGEPGRVRVFFDGVEYDALDPRTGGQVDLGTIPLYGLEEVAVERAAGELRVHLRSWRVENTTPATRVDVGAGAENLTVYRGYYGRRFDSGVGLQVAAQQFSVLNGLTRGDGDSFGGIGRLGWARGDWSLDGVAMRTGRLRAGTRRYIRTTPQENAIGRFEGSERLAYLRLGWRQPDADGLWWQAIAATQQYVEDDSLASSATTPDSDTLRSQAQYVFTGGVTKGPLRVSAAARYRVAEGSGRFAPSARASWDAGRLSLAGSADLVGPDSTRRVDASARVQLLPWVHLGGAASQHTPVSEAAGGPARSTMRGELGFEFRRRWISAGVVQRSAARVAGMPVFDSLYIAALIPESQGLMLALGGPIWGPFSLDAQVVDWGDEQLYRPKVQARSQLSVETAFRRWLKRDTFLLRAAFLHEYRSDMLTPAPGGTFARAKGASALSTLLDIRLGSAHIFWHNRNFTGQVYETLPGFLMPRLIQQYGVRWEFWN